MNATMTADDVVPPETLPPPAPPAQPQRGPGAGAAILLATAAVVAAVLVARSSFVAGQASESWQKAVREELKRSAALVEDVRFVYTDEAPLSFIVLGANTMADEMTGRAEDAGSPLRERLEIEARTNALVAETIGPASAIASDEKYAHEDGGYDLALRLADVRAETPDLVVLDPGVAQERGDGLAETADRLIAVAVLAAAAFLFAALAQVFRRGHLALLVVGWVALGAAVVTGIAVEVLG